ncbi:Uncharacterised protein [uncultured archaeon]|nr:Uncharacterised protein [uncultured archaeon]
MAKECTSEDLWKEWSNSHNPEQRRYADLLFPEFSIRHEVDLARRAEKKDLVIRMGEIIQKYMHPKMDSYRSTDHAYRALLEIRTLVA